MSRSVEGASRAAWALGGLAIVPYIVPAIAIWAAQPPVSTWTAPWALALYAALVIGGVGLLRLRLATAGGAPLRPAQLVVATLSPLIAIGAAALAPVIGFRWVYALQVAALSVQGLWDLGGGTMPVLMRRMRPIVSAGGLICLLIGLIGA